MQISSGNILTITLMSLFLFMSPAFAKDTKALPGIVCDRFEIKAILSGTALQIAIDTDLPGKTKIGIDVDRFYTETGNKKNTYKISYFSGDGTVEEWKEARTISLDNQKWQQTLEIKQQELKRAGLSAKVEAIQDKVTVRAFLMPEQGDGVWNENLSGKAVSNQAKSKNFPDNKVSKEVQLSFPLDTMTPNQSACQKYKAWQPAPEASLDLSVFNEVLAGKVMRQDGESSVLVLWPKEDQISHSLYLKLVPQVCTAFIMQEVKKGESKIETVHLANAGGYQGFTFNNVRNVCTSIEKTKSDISAREGLIEANSVVFASPCEPPSSFESLRRQDDLSVTVTPENESSLKSKARQQCEKDVRSSAMYSGAADFSLFGWETRILGHLINVTGEASLLNSFGAKLPHKFYCKYEITSGDGLREIETMVYPD